MNLKSLIWEDMLQESKEDKVGPRIKRLLRMILKKIYMGYTLFLTS